MSDQKETTIRELAGVRGSKLTSNINKDWIHVAEWNDCICVQLHSESVGLTVLEARRLADLIYRIAERTEARLGKPDDRSDE